MSAYKLVNGLWQIAVYYVMYIFLVYDYIDAYINIIICSPAILSYT